MNKKTIKVAAAAVVAASSFVVPVATEAAVNYGKIAKDGVATQKKAYDTYVASVKAGKVVDRATVIQLFNNSKKAFTVATAIVKKAPKNASLTYRKQLADAYNQYTKPLYTYRLALESVTSLEVAVAAISSGKTVDEKKALLTKVQAMLQDTKVAAQLAAVEPFGRDLLTKKVIVQTELTAQIAKQLNDIVTPPAVTINATVSVTADQAVVVADVTGFDNKEVAAKLYTNGDLTKAPIATTKATVVNGKATFTFAKLPTGTHKVIIEAGTVVSQPKDIMIAPPATAQVESVRILNLREVEVKFNKALVASELAKVTNYVIGTNSNPTSVTVADDNKSVVLLMSSQQAFANYSTNKVTIRKEVGLVVDAISENVTAADTSIPALEKVELSGSRDLKLTFSEPLDDSLNLATTVSAFALNNGMYTLDPTTATYSGRTLTIKVLADLPEGTYSLKVNPNILKDKAGYPVIPTSISFDVKRDMSVPTATVVASTETTATVKFSKPMANVAGNSNLLVTHTYNTPTNQITGTSITNPTGDNQTFVITFSAARPFPPGATTLFFSYTNQAGTVIKDLWNNVYLLTNLTVSTVADTSRPEVVAVEVVDAAKLKVTFTEDVDASTALTASNYTVRDSSGAAVTLSAPQFETNSKRVVLLTTVTPFAGGTYSLEVRNIRDTSIAGNMLTTTSRSFATVDRIAPTIKDKNTGLAGTQIKQISDTKLKIEFSETMDPSTLLDRNNYRYDGVALSANAVIETADSNKAVVITFPAPINAAKDVVVGRFKDAAGNWSESFQQQLDIDGLSTISFSSVEVTGKNTINVTVDDVVANAVATDFEVSINNGASYLTGAAGILSVYPSVVNGKTTLTFTIGTDMTDTSVSGAKSVYVRTVSAPGVQGSTTYAKNPYGIALNFTSTPALDRYKPIVVSRTIADTNNNGKLDQVNVKFSEALQVSSVMYDAFQVEGYTITNLVTNGDTVTLTLAEKDVTDLTATPKVQLLKTIRDAAFNEFTPETTGTTVTKP